MLIKTPSLWGSFFCLFFLFFSHSSLAIFIPTERSIEQLASHPQWLRLLHYDISYQQGTFLTKDFYLSHQGRDDPLAELSATLEAVNTIVASESHPRCRFPARYAWLADQFQQPQWKVIPPTCQKLKRWLAENSLRSVSLLMVSGYMGNPASMFGHAILKLNTKNKGNELFVTTLNYGALVPPKESAVLYIIKGLFGGYQAGYSDRYFYTQDIVYSNTEARDIWEYELNLDIDQVRFLQLHIWEIIGKKKQYFFLTRNCAYELARILDVVMNPSLSQPAYAWYVPAELFDRLHDLGANLPGESVPLIKKIQYHPSAERLLIHEYENLSGRIKARAQKFLNNPNVARIDEVLMGLTLMEQQTLLDFLFSYQHFLFIKESPKPSQETQSLKHALLVKRLALPPSSSVSYSVPEKPSPSQGQRSSILGIGALAGEENRALMKLTAFTQEPTGRNSLDGGELTVLDLYLGLEEDKLVVEKLDYLRIFHHALSPLPMASSWSWRLQLRTQREVGGEFDHQFYFGVGRTKKIGNVLLYGLVTPSLHSRSSLLRVRPEGGLLFPLKNTLRLHMEMGMEHKRDNWQTTAIGTIQYSPSRKLSLLLEYRKEMEPSWQLMLRTHW